MPALDQVPVFPQGSRVLVSYDDDSCDVISPLLSSPITVDRQPAWQLLGRRLVEMLGAL